MSVGARDYIDKLLVQKYAQEKVDNHDANAMESKISADDMLDAMTVSADHFKNMMLINSRLTNVCYGVIAKSVRYIQTEEVV